MAKITTRVAGLGACAALLAGPAGLAALGAGVSHMITEPGQRYSLTRFRDHAGAARRGARAGAAAWAGAAGWTRYRVPVKGQANVQEVAAPGRDDAWAAGFTIHNSGLAGRGGPEVGLAGRGGPEVGWPGRGGPEVGWPGRGGPEVGWPGRGGPEEGASGRMAGPGQAAAVNQAGRAVAGRAVAGQIPCPFTGFLDSLMLHWNGRAWGRVRVPDVNRINYLSAAGPSSAWASGDCGLLGWNGRAWRLAGFPMPAASLQPEPGDVAAVSPDDAWLLGSTYNVKRNATGGFVDRWNGRRWQRVTLPASLGLSGNYELDAVAARGPRDVWIAGTATSLSTLRTQVILLHWDGRTWRRRPSPSGLGYTIFVVGARILSATDAWVVGWDKVAPDEDQPRHPLALHWDGRRWTATRVPAGRGELYSAAQAGGRLLAVGDTFSPDQTSYAIDILRWTGRAWVHGAVPASGPGSLVGIAAIPGGGVWVTGSTGDNTGETGNTAIRPLIARQG